MLSGVTPPEISIKTLSLRSLSFKEFKTFSISSTCMLSSIIISARASAAWMASSRLSTSISIFLVKLAYSLALQIAVSTSPTSARWLSLISTASSSRYRCVSPPPMRTASFSQNCIPGVVLRVAETKIFEFPSLAFSTICEVWVAIPLILIRRFKIVLSMVKMAWALPSISMTMSPVFKSVPSFLTLLVVIPNSPNR